MKSMVLSLQVQIRHAVHISYICIEQCPDQGVFCHAGKDWSNKRDQPHSDRTIIKRPHCQFVSEALRQRRLLPYCRNRDFVEQLNMARIVEPELVCVLGSNLSCRSGTLA